MIHYQPDDIAEMKPETFKITYSAQPDSMSHMGCQYGGALCIGITWSEEEGTVETWQHGSFNPELYPVLEVAPAHWDQRG